MLLSTGMSTIEQVDRAVEISAQRTSILLHAVSTYPARYDELNLRVMATLRERYGVPVGYSGHETGLASSVAAVALGACIVERHITLDRSMWGSDQAASLEPSGLTRLLSDIHLVEMSLGSPEKRVLDREHPPRRPPPPSALSGFAASRRSPWTWTASSPTEGSCGAATARS